MVIFLKKKKAIAIYSPSERRNLILRYFICVGALSWLTGDSRRPFSLGFSENGLSGQPVCIIIILKYNSLKHNSIQIYSRS